MHAIKLSFIFSVRRRRPTHSTLLTGRTTGVLVFGFAPRGRRAERCAQRGFTLTCAVTSSSPSRLPCVL